MICSIGDAVSATNTLGMVTFTNSEPFRIKERTRGNASRTLILSVLSPCERRCLKHIRFCRVTRRRQISGSANISLRTAIRERPWCIADRTHLPRPLGNQKEISMEFRWFSRTRLSSRIRTPVKGKICSLKLSSQGMCIRPINIIARTIARVPQRTH
jgi:hypothetical protein